VKGLKSKANPAGTWTAWKSALSSISERASSTTVAGLRTRVRNCGGYSTTHSMAWQVVDAQKAFDHAVSKGATPYTDPDKTMDVPAILGIGGSLIYFIGNHPIFNGIWS